MNYQPNENRYDGRMPYRRCGRSGLLLPEISLGCWHNFGGDTVTENQRQMIYTAFDAGITHFDLANNYGPPFGTAEINVGQIIRDLPRDELIVSSKAGYDMWPGPYGEWGSRKYLTASLDQSLKRLNLDYVDIFYSHRFDPDTPLEETLGALNAAVRHGKALYIGISSYNTEQSQKAVEICRREGFERLLIHQPNYSMFNRWIEVTLLDALEAAGVGVITFCPLFQGLLTDRYLNGIPDSSRYATVPGLLRDEEMGSEVLAIVQQLNEIAKLREQSLAQLAISWILRDSRITSVLCGASRPQQIVENCKAVTNTEFSIDELAAIEKVLEPLSLPKSHWATES